VIFTDEELDHQPWPGWIDADTVIPRRRARRLSWLVIPTMLLTLGGLGVTALQAPPAYAASSWYMHGPGGGNATVAFVQAASATETATATTIATTIATTVGNTLLV
jgi:hypothetical protein